jgi:hypothetical protein
LLYCTHVPYSGVGQLNYPVDAVHVLIGSSQPQSFFLEVFSEISVAKRTFSYDQAEPKATQAGFVPYWL